MACWSSRARRRLRRRRTPQHCYLQRQLCEALGLDAADVRVVTPQVGGGFGGKAGLYHQFTAIAAAARLSGRPVVWVPPRSEDMKSLLHGRGQIQYAELGCREDGTFTSLRIQLVNDAGAYPNVGAHLPGLTKNMAQGTYRFDEIQFDIAVALQNKIAFKDGVIELACVI